MLKVKGIRTTSLALALLFLSLYLPLAALLYTPSWYTFNCQFHDHCERIGMPMAHLHAQELVEYFRHQIELSNAWSEREQQHLAEVRVLYDYLLVLAALALLVIAATWNKHELGRISLINLGIICSLLLVLPVFGYVWRNVFHELMFANNLWQTTHQDLTWYITPRVLFRNSFIAIILLGLAFNLLCLAFGRYWAKK